MSQTVTRRRSHRSNSVPREDMTSEFILRKLTAICVFIGGSPKNPGRIRTCKLAERREAAELAHLPNLCGVRSSSRLLAGGPVGCTASLRRRQRRQMLLRGDFDHNALPVR